MLFNASSGCMYTGKLEHMPSEKLLYAAVCQQKQWDDSVKQIQRTEHAHLSKIVLCSC